MQQSGGQAMTVETMSASEQPGVLRVARLDPTMPLPTRAHSWDAGIDLSASAAVDLAPGERALVGTGLAVGIPPGFVGLVHPRSGLAARVGLSIVNAPGTIDAGYTGEVRINLINLDPHEPIRIERGDRIAQLLIQQVETWEVVEVDSLGESERGSGGYGSSGGHARLEDAREGSDR